MKTKLQIPLNFNKFAASTRARMVISLLFFLQMFAQAQPPAFTLTVVPTDETCLGNGTLTFAVQGTDPAATIIYSVYELPNEATPIAVQNETFLGSRTAGTYKVVATQILGLESNTQTVTVVINSNIVPLAYTITSTNSICADGVMTIAITGGVGAQYEIISGPVTRPLQSSLVFTMLPAGVYEVRAFNNCGDGTVVTHTLLSDSANIHVGDAAFPERQLPSCNTITVGNSLSTEDNDVIAYPLTLHYTIYAPNGSIAQEFTQAIPGGDPELYNATQVIPFFYDQIYFYDLSVTDGCGNVFTINNMPIQQKLTAQITAQAAQCGEKYLTVTAGTYMPDFTVEWLEVPAGFVPIDFNPGHPGGFLDTADYGGPTMAVPFGHYIVRITDGCGRTAEADVTLTDLPAEPEKELMQYPGCQSYMSQVKITVPGFTIVSAIITVAPSEYAIAIPDDVSDQVTLEDGLVLQYLPTGNYTVILIDECGNTYPYEFFVPPMDTTVSPSTRPDCEVGKGAVRIRGNSTVLLSIMMTQAPPEFTQPLPYDVSLYLTPDGIFSMNNLPPGIYAFTVLDNCGEQNIVANISVPAYAITANDFSLSPHCGSFDLTLTHSANGVSQTFWLQELDTTTNTWGHPGTGVPYPDGTVPTSLNSLAITNNFTTLNLVYLGHFRILKRFETLENGNIGQFKNCFEVLAEFDYTGEIQFTGVEKLTCDGESMDVRVFAIGSPPLIYSIVAKDGEPFLVNNGTNNLFVDLEPAIYTFRVQQSCGDSRDFTIDVAQLPSLAQANQLGNMAACDDSSADGIEIFTLTDQDAAVLGAQNPADFTISYHLTLEDAANNVNALPANYASGNDTIYCRLDYNGSADCYDVTSFDLVVNPYPVLQMPLTWGLCQGASVTITADAGLVSYLWSTGETTQSITVSLAGQYTLEVVKAYPTGNCTGIFTIDVTPSTPPVIDHIEISDWTDDENEITVILDATATGSYTYSIDNVNFQDSNTFTGLLTGPYTIYVHGANGCGQDQYDTYLLTYPKYFTPNGDGFHDHWRIRFSQMEPNLKTYVYDRYGKLITGFMPDSMGWDGTLNGELLPSTDYWFVVIRENGKHLRGHFAMKR